MAWASAQVATLGGVAYPDYVKRVPIPELGPDIYMMMVNPWMLPKEKPLNKNATDEERTARINQRMADLIREWNVPDFRTDQVLPLPKDDPTVFDRVPEIITAKMGQAINAMDLDAEWDPTKRPEAAEAPTMAPTALLSKSEPSKN